MRLQLITKSQNLLSMKTVLLRSLQKLCLVVFGLLLSYSILADDAVQPSDTVTNPINPVINQIYELVDRRNPTSPIFQQALASANLETQRTALLGLGRIGGKVAIDLASPFLTNPNPALRQMAAFALGISGNQQAVPHLWAQLEKEIDDSVKHEIYLGLGNLGENGLVNKMMQRLTRETSLTGKSSLFHGLGIALVFHADSVEDYSAIDYQGVLKLFANSPQIAPQIGLFLSRVPKIDSYLSGAQLLPLTQLTLSPLGQVYLAKMIAKVSKKSSVDDRALLAWLIEQSESEELSVQLEAIVSMKNLLEFPQALIQLGKLHVSSNPIIAYTALNTIAESELDSSEVIALLKNQLKNQNPAMVVSAIAGLSKRHSKDQMSWVVSLFKHQSAYVKIQLLNILKNKPETDFSHLIAHFVKDDNLEVAQYAKQQLSEQAEVTNTLAISPSFAEAMASTGQKIKLKTTVGDITIQLLPEAPFTSWHFINNAKSGYLTNSYFSRVIGNFVAQGGDTIGDGEGASTHTIREEVNLLAHETMSVGMATSGKDTGSSQFFINTARNLHLDRNYTVFAKVINGQENVLHMTNGARVLGFELLP